MTNLNKFVVIGFGMAFLGESASLLASLGCTLAILGGVWFSKAKTSLASRMRADREATQAAAATSPPQEAQTGGAPGGHPVPPV